MFHLIFLFKHVCVCPEYIWTDDSNNLYLAEEKERIKLILLAINTSKIIFPSQY